MKTRPSVHRTILVLTAVLSASWPARSDFAVEQDPVSTAESAARTDAGTGEGRRFAESVGQAFGREHRTTIQRCAKDAKRRELADFDLFLRVDGEGIVDHALVRPATAFAACVRNSIPGWKVLVPPHAGFWVKVAVNLKRK